MDGDGRYAWDQKGVGGGVGGWNPLNSIEKGLKILCRYLEEQLNFA